MTADDYLAQIERELCGSRAARRRLLAELRAHIDDAFRAGDTDAVDLLGPPSALVTAWRAHVTAVRARTRRRAAFLALTITMAGALGVVQHASGHRSPPEPCRSHAVHAAQACNPQ